MNRETREELELEKLSAEIKKLVAETRKFKAEEEKLKREAMFSPFAVGAALIAALVTLISFMRK
jgi:F0F1-type ATP synthase assembly protein I